MNQEKSKERRRKKNVLKHRVIQERDLSQEDLERKIRAHRKKIRKRVVLGIFLGVLVLGAFFIYENIRTYGSYSVQWETEKIASGEVNYSAFAGGLLQYGSDGIMYYDKDGDMMWSQAYQMNSPRLAINGSYLLVYDIGSIQFMVFDQNGYVGGGSAPIPIILGSISSKQGVVTLIGEESLGHIFYFYDRKGTKLAIEKKTLFTDSGSAFHVHFFGWRIGDGEFCLY